MDERYIAAVDLGSSNIALTVAKIEGNDVQVIFHRQVPSDGIRYSYVLQPQRVSNALSTLVKEAEAELCIRIFQVVVGLPRYYVRQEKAQGEIPRTDTESCISREEVENLKHITLDDYPLTDPEKEFIYGAVAQSYATDDNFQAMESDVEGMVSERLQGDFRVFIGSRKNVNNIDKVFNDLGLAIAHKYFVPDIQSKMVLTHEEMDNGVALIDLGGGVTSVTVYQNGIMRHYAAIPFGGNSVTNDIKMEGGFSASLAENIKIAFGSCMPDKLASLSEKTIRVNYPDGATTKDIPVRYLSEVIAAREKEIIEAMLFEIQRSGFPDTLRSGVVITGGGAEMTNIANLIKEMSGYNVRVGYPLHKFSSDNKCQGVFDTCSSTVIGMVLAGKQDRLLNCIEEMPKPVEPVEEEVETPAAGVDEKAGSGSLFSAEEMGTADAAEPARGKDRVGKKKPKKDKAIWRVFKRVEDTMTLFYNDMENED